MPTLLETIDASFTELDARQRQLIGGVPEDKLFWTPVHVSDSMISLSVGGAVLRSAAMVEQAFLGLTRRLWDDPFEWTLPEKLSTTSAILSYLDEVCDTRRTGLGFLRTDDDLLRELPAPEKLCSVFDVLAGALSRAENHLGRGEAVRKLLG